VVFTGAGLVDPHRQWRLHFSQSQQTGSCPHEHSCQSCPRITIFFSFSKSFNRSAVLTGGRPAKRSTRAVPLQGTAKQPKTGQQDGLGQY